MAHLAEALRQIAVMLTPFLTEAPAKMFEQLGAAEASWKTWDSLQNFGVIKSGTKVSKGQPIFPRLETEPEVEYIKSKMQGPAPKVEEKKEESAPKEELAEISIDDFFKVDLRVAEVLHAEPVKGADKLLKLQLDLGSEKRQVVSGIAKFYSPEELKGKKVICVTNLKPVKLRGELSQGMILAGTDNGKLSLATIDQTLANGTKIK